MVDGTPAVSSVSQHRGEPFLPPSSSSSSSLPSRINIKRPPHVCERGDVPRLSSACLLLLNLPTSCVTTAAQQIDTARSGLVRDEILMSS